MDYFTKWPEARVIFIIKAETVAKFIYKEIICRHGKQLKPIVHIEPIWTDMCLNSCCAYTESYRKLTKCPVCGSERFQHKKPCKQYSYFSFIERLTIQYRNYDCAKELHYRANYTSQKLYKCNI